MNQDTLRRDVNFANLYLTHKLLSNVEASHAHLFSDDTVSKDVATFKSMRDNLAMAIFGNIKEAGVINSTAFYKGNYYPIFSLFYRTYEIPILVLPNKTGTGMLLFYDKDPTIDFEIAEVECTVGDRYTDVSDNIVPFLKDILDKESKLHIEAKRIHGIAEVFINNYTMVSEGNIKKFLAKSGEEIKSTRNFQPIIASDGTMLCCKEGLFGLYDVSEIIESGISIALVQMDDTEFFCMHTLSDEDITVNSKLYAECSVEGEFLYAEGALDNLDIKAKKLGRNMKRVPVAILDKMSKYISKFRGLYRSYKQSRDDKLREQLINDEIIPFFDEIFEWVASVAVTYGTYSLAIVNPVMALVGGCLTKMILTKRTKDRKKLALMFLKREIDIVDEKINDAKSANNTQAKYALMRIKGELEKKLEEIRFDNRLS